MSRETVASRIMAALMIRNPRLDVPEEHFAKEAVKHADALLSELERTSKPPGYTWETLDQAEKRISSTLKEYPEGEE